MARRKIVVGQSTADGASTDNRELAFERNILVANMLLEGYNYEDSFLIDERLI